MILIKTTPKTTFTVEAQFTPQELGYLYALVNGKKTEEYSNNFRTKFTNAFNEFYANMAKSIQDLTPQIKTDTPAPKPVDEE